VTAGQRQAAASAAASAAAAAADGGGGGGFMNCVQQAMLPAGLPVLPQAEVGACYLAAGDQAAGGDWFDALQFGDRAVALVVGDIAGSGVAASAAMGQLRAVLAELLAASTDVPGVLARADAFAARNPELQAASLAIAALDPASGSLRYATCGCPPPLILAADGTARFLPCSAAGPLGVGSRPALATGLLRSGEALLLYTNGLINRPGKTVSQAMAELAAAAAHAAIQPAEAAHLPPGGRPDLGSPGQDGAESTADRICRQTVEQVAAAGYDDDIAVVAVRRLVAPVKPLRLVLPAKLGSLRIIRRAFGEWLDQLEPALGERTDIELAVAETVTNAVEHAYPEDQPGQVELEARLTADGRLDCSITDYGSWRPPDLGVSHRGYGLMVASQVVDQMDVRHPRQAGDGASDAPGTIVRLRHRLRRLPPRCDRQPRAGRPAIWEPDRPGAPLEVRTTTEDGGVRVRVSGPVDAATAPRLSRQLLTASRGGTISLTVDVTGVSQLTSSGIRVLYQVRDRITAQEQELTLLATPGSSVALLLEFANLSASFPVDVSHL